MSTPPEGHVVIRYTILQGGVEKGYKPSFPSLIYMEEVKALYVLARALNMFKPMNVGFLSDDVTVTVEHASRGGQWTLNYPATEWFGDAVRQLGYAVPA